MNEIDSLLGLDEAEVKGIPINEKYRIETYDVKNVMVKEKYLTKATKDNPSEEAWRIISYHANIEQAFKSIVDKEINMTINEGLEAVVKKIEELKNIKNMAEKELKDYEKEDR